MASKGAVLLSVMSYVALASPLAGRDCASEWSQCGGRNWSGATCCIAGSSCVTQNEYYSQCQPGSGTSGGSPPATTTIASPTSGQGPTPTSGAPVGSGTAVWSGNPYLGVDLWANNFYKSEVTQSAIPHLTGAMATAAAKVANVPSYLWLDTFSKTTLMDQTLADIKAANSKGGNYAAQFVVYDLPDHDCSAAASNGEYSIANNGVNNYKHYIDAIHDVIVKYSGIRILLVIEPDSLANLVTNLSVPKCANAQSAYIECVTYAITKLNLPNVAMYLDAGHAGWLGWPANQAPAAQLFASVYRNASSPASVRGLATNVANYNAWSISSPPSYTQGNPVYDEQLFVHALGPLLAQNGWSGAHFITEQSRSGKQPTGQQAWGDWCNVKGAGFGTRPSANTGDSLLDAFVWVKPGGEADGTSNTSAARYDFHCGLSDALQPAPEAGTWFQDYFVQLINNANPSFL